jgi:lipopolysaccharide export system permease protein
MHMRIKLLNKLICSDFIKIFLLVTFILSSLFSFIIFSRQFDDINEGYYNLGHAIIYVILTLPGRMLEFSPMSALIAAIFTLENYIRHFELIAIKAAGGTNKYIINVFLIFSLTLSIVIYILLEFVIPPLDQWANKIKAAAISKNENLMIGKQGFWAKENNTFINIKKIRPGNVLEDIFFYETTDTGQMTKITYSKEANIIDSHNIVLYNVVQKIFTKKGINSRHLSQLERKVKTGFLKDKIIYMPLESASLSELSKQIRELKERGENYDYASSSFWQKIATPISVLSMILLCLPFLINRMPARKELGLEVSLAIAGGGAIYLFRYILSYVVLLYNMNPFTLIMGPILIILAIDFFLIIKSIDQW